MNQKIYGIHTVQAIFKKRPQDILVLYYQPNESHNQRIQDLLAEAKHLDINCQQIHDLDEWLNEEKSHQKIVHQGIACHIKSQQQRNEKQLKQDLLNLREQAPLLVILDSIVDPQNLGSILRSCEAAGASGVILLNHNTAPINQTVCKVACGATEFIPIYKVSNLSRIINILKENNIWIVGMALPVESDFPHYSSLFDIDLKLAIGIVVGSESSGIRPINLKQCDELAYLPMLGVTQSLNVANATSIALFEALRQRQINRQK